VSTAIQAPRRAVGHKLRYLLLVLLVSFVVLSVNSAYLGGVTFLEWLSDENHQDFTYQVMFLVHLALGLAIVIPILIFLGVHMRNTWHRSNRQAVYAGLALGVAVVVLLISGLLLIRFDGFSLRDPTVRSILYWSHILVPFLVVWLFVLHRLAGPRIQWRVGAMSAGLGGAFALALVVFQAQDPLALSRPSDIGTTDFSPSLIKTASGNTIPAETLMMDQYCSTCHADVHAQWSQSVHRFSSFNNPVYRFSVRNTRQQALEKDGHVNASRFCAGCHDLVPLLSGAFDDPNFDDVNHPTAMAGITCTSCHAITSVDSVRGTSDFTIEEPVHYPFAYSDNAFLQWVNGQLIKAKPDFHRQTFLKPLHETTEFCSTCHKLHLPEELNNYRWLRGQNHYDSFLISGVSGHGVTSFYYPPQAQANCNGCHMPQQPSADFGSRDRDGDGIYTVSNHLFPAANTGIAHILGFDQEVMDAHQAFLKDSVRVDLMALREGGEIDGPLIGPIRPQVPILRPGQTYLLQTVIRNVSVGHHFTQGTTDSNEVWLAVEVRHNGELIGQSGALDPNDLSVDPWSHFVNVYLLDRDGNRIERRNPEDIFVSLYNHQLPPGGADLIHYELQVPNGLEGELEVSIALNYRKFDTRLMSYVEGEAFVKNDLPITVISRDSVTFPLGKQGGFVDGPERGIPDWVRWNDYGIGALRKPKNRQLRQATEAFTRVEGLGHGAGALNLARVYLAEGRLAEATDALRRAGSHENPPPPWSLAWFGAQVLFQEGRYEPAIEAMMALVNTQFPEARARGFDFSRDYRLLNQLGLAFMEWSDQLIDEAQLDALESAATWLTKSLIQDPENVTAHYNLAQVYRRLGDEASADYHSSEHERYRVDDNARDRAVAIARRRDAAADFAADPVVIYPLIPSRPVAYEP
jgi:tetratricopeptide (TPR) repeat protein